MPFDRAAHGRWPGLVFVAIASFHAAAAWVGGPAPNWHGQTSEYYPLLTDAFLAGQTSLLVKPSAELLALPDPYDHIANARFRMHDASLYRGKYYLFYGPTPVILLFLPFKVLTGSHLPTRIAVALFSIIGFACACRLFFLLAKREKWDCPPWFNSAAVLLLGTGPAVSVLLARPSFYEVAIAGGYSLVMAGFLLTAHSLGQDPPRARLLLGAGLCFGLAVGCRPNFVLTAILMVALMAIRLRSDKLRALAFAGPLVLCGILFAGYNYARFQNPFELGVRYQLLDNTKEVVNNLFSHSLRNLVPTLYVLVLSPGQLPPAEVAMGLFRWSPVAILGLLTPWSLRHGPGKDRVKLGSTRFTVLGIYVSSLCTLILLALLGFVNQRYLVDFAPGFGLLSLCLSAAAWQTVHRLRNSWQILFGFAILGATLYSTVLDFLICVSRVPS